MFTGSKTYLLTPNFLFFFQFFQLLLFIMPISSSKQIQPALYGRGYRQNPHELQQESGGCLSFDHSFDSRCPPVVTPDTTIIAVCGANDVGSNNNNSAGPDADGPFFSDFYFFHHFFRSMAKNQYWMTCVKQQDLIKNYKEFVHGDPHSNDRRVVLDETFAEKM